MIEQSAISSYLPVWAVLILLLGGVLAFVFNYYSRPWRNAFMIAAVLLSFGMIFAMYPAVNRGTVYQAALDLLPPLGLTFRVDYLSFFMGLLFTFLGIIIVIYTLEYMKNDPGQNRFFPCLMFALGGSLGVVLAGDLFSLFLFFEFMSLMFFVLAIHHQTAEAFAASIKFLYVAIASGVSFFIAAVIVYRVTGTFVFEAGGMIDEATPALAVAFLGFLFAFGAKAAMFPLHFWMPDVYAHAPTPASFVSSAIMLKTGAYGLIRVFYSIFGISFLDTTGWNAVLLALASITILFGSMVAITQDDLFRRLAYSGIAQVGYILLGIAMLTEMAFIGNVYHIFAHAFMKGCLFLCAGAILMKTGKRKISEMGGLGLKMPITMLCFTFPALTSVGIPPMNIFVSKWHLSLGALAIGQPLYVVILLVSSILNAAYYLPIVFKAFFGVEGEGKLAFRWNEVPWMMIVPIAVLALGCVVFTLPSQNWPLHLVKAVAGQIVVN